ncbi:hypothetical protein [Zhenhengia yiwuensis]|uniref:Uncharacterized protein n=1 Tax=Zhenhengia yiwuensis TaxID=2763666 RepID=A0A926IGF5_9FIRM|nr:hypothetical protein [Zhenhengia yiwuensis]MBC8581496.1 hypothetical protein [Zhenhengia yiwuensis]
MEALFNLINDKEDLALENTIIKWRIERYEELLEEILECLCEEDVLAMQYAIKYKKLKEVEIGR